MQEPPLEPGACISVQLNRAERIMAMLKIEKCPSRNTICDVLYGITGLIEEA